MDQNAGYMPPGGGAPNDTRPKVVILGAGYAGAKCAQVIQKKLHHTVDLVVIEKRKASVHKIAAARAAVLGNNYSERVLVPNDNLMQPGLGRMIHENIVNVTDHSVQLASGVEVPYDYLVCATGSLNFSVCEPPLRYSDRNSMKKFYDKVSKKIRSCERIIIVGGGPVGIELAGEIRYEYHNKVVTVVHSGHKLCSKLNPPPSKGFYKKIAQKLEGIGVKLYLGQKLVVDWREHGNKPYISGEAEYTTDRGEKIPADLVLLCAGKKITNAFYPGDWVDNLSGQIKVKRTLQILSMPNVFAIGDLNDIPENKQALFAKRQGEVAGKNIAKLVAGKKSLTKYSPGFGLKRTFIFVTAGRNKGTGYLGFFTVGSSLTRRLKGKDLSTKDTWKDFGIDDNIPLEVGGPSKGNKLGTVARVPDMMVGQNNAYNLRTRSMEQRHKSMESTTSLADMYSDEDLRDSMLKRADPSQNQMQPQASFGEISTPAAPHSSGMRREDVVSFVGSKAGRGESVNFRSPNMSSPAFMVPVSTTDLDRQRQATMEKSKKRSGRSTGISAGAGLQPVERGPSGYQRNQKADNGGW